MGPTQTQLSNQATPLTEDVVSILREALGDGFGFATSAQRQVSGGAGRALDQALTPFDESATVAALRESQTLDRRRAHQDLNEQFGIAGSRQGTPLAVGHARLDEGLIPRQNRELGDLLFRGFATQMGALPGILGAATSANQQLLNPFLQLALAGTVNPATGPSGFSQVTSGIGELFG